MKNKNALFICENNEEAEDLSKIAIALTDYETIYIDIRAFYGKRNEKLSCYDNVIEINKPFRGRYPSWTKVKKIVAVIYVYMHCIKVCLNNDISVMYSGIPIINARLLKFTFKKIKYYSYIRSVFQARDKQKSLVWRLFEYIGLKEILPFKADHYFVTGNASKVMLEGLGVNKKAITISGSISLSDIKRCERPDEKKGKYTGMLYLSGAHKWHGDVEMEQFQKKLIEKLKITTIQNNINFVIRPHPRDLENDGYRKIAIIDERNTSDSLSYYSNNGKWLIVSNFSMMGFEFEYMGLDSVFIAPESAKLFFHDWFESTSSEAFSDIEIIERILKHPGSVCPSGNNVYSNTDNPIEVILRLG